jgi:hypothetical protein
VAFAALAAFLFPASLAAADSFTPIRMTITINPVARLRQALAVKVAVSADPGVLDGSEGQMRVGVKLAGECGGTYATTPGNQLLNKPLSPQPATGKAYSGSASGSGKPTSYGVQTVCVFLGDARVGRIYANDESMTVDVSKPCTTTASKYDGAEKKLKRAQKKLKKTKRHAARKRLKRTIAKDKRTANADRRRARKACGAGVKL